MTENQDSELSEKAAAGDVEAMCSLALLLEIGLERPRDIKEAGFWWFKAAELGSELAKEKITHLLENGSLTPPDIDNYKKMLDSIANSRAPSGYSDGQEIAVKILLAEDEDDFREILRINLEERGYRVIEAFDGEMALQTLMANPDISIIISDLKMPKLNGMQFIKTLRRMQIAEHAAIIVITAHARPELIELGRKYNVKHWLVKPFSADTLLEAVDKLAKRKKAVA